MLRPGAGWRSERPARMACAILVLVAGFSRFTPTAQAQPGVFGDWGGARPWLSEHGVDLDVGYINEFAYAASGGPATPADADQFSFGGSFDLHKLAGVPDAKMVFSFTDRNGTSLSARRGLETLLEVQEIYGEGDYTRLNQLFWEQQLVNHHVTLKLGRLTGTFDFMPFSCNFQNITFCASVPSHNVVPNWVAFPGGTWAGVARFAPKPEWYAQFGVYEVDPALQEHGARFTVGRPFGGLGRRYVFEFGWLPTGDVEGSGYRAGVWYDDVGGSDFYSNSDGQPLATHGGAPLQHHQQSGFYLMAQQRVWTPGLGDRGLSLFMNFVQADRQISVKDQIAEVGLFWTGPLSARPQDEVGAAIARNHVSSRLAASERLYNAAVAGPEGTAARPVQTAEFPFEIYYGLTLTPAVTLRPNLQLIRAPDGVSSHATLVVLGLHFSALF